MAGRAVCFLSYAHHRRLKRKQQYAFKIYDFNNKAYSMRSIAKHTARAANLRFEKSSMLRYAAHRKQKAHRKIKAHRKQQYAPFMCV